MKNLIVIPSRWKSSRFPGKSLALIHGKTMIERVWDKCKKSKEAQEVIVATDSSKISNFCKKKNINVMMTSNKHLTGSDRIGEVARKIKADIYVNVQGDEPLIKPTNIDRIIEYLKSNKKKGYHVVLGYYNSKRIKFNNQNPTYLVKNKKKEVLYLSRSEIPSNSKSIKLKIG